MPARNADPRFDSNLPPGARLAYRRMLEHAVRHSPYYRDQAWAARLRAGQSVAIEEIPVTAKETVRDNVTAFHSGSVPSEDGTIYEKHTSGSTGTPLRVPKTALHFAFNEAENRRLKNGWYFEAHLRRAHATNSEEGRKLGELDEIAGANGRRSWTLHTGDPAAVADLLRKMRPTLLSARTSVAKAVLEDYPDIDFLQLVSTVGETVSPDFGAFVARLPDCRHFDIYGAVETGIIAATCARCGRYHMAYRHLGIEHLNDDGSRTAAGELGRVVATPLYNLAMPLIRYDIGDYAVRSAETDCGDSGISFDRVIGKQRNLFKLSDGSRVLPYLVKPALFELGVKQYKLVQTTIRDVEFRYVPQVAGFVVDEAAVQRLVDEAISPLLRVTCAAVDDIPLRPNAKYFIYESLI